MKRKGEWKYEQDGHEDDEDFESKDENVGGTTQAIPKQARSNSGGALPERTRKQSTIRQ